MKTNSIFKITDFLSNMLFKEAGGSSSSDKPKNRVCPECMSPDCPMLNGGYSCSQLPYESGKSYLYYSKDAMYDDLDDHTYNSKRKDYVEVSCVYNDREDTYTVYRDPRNEYNKAYITIREEKDGYYYDGKHVGYYSHTHRDNPEASYPKDYDMKDTYPGLPAYIYYHREEYPIGDRPEPEVDPSKTQGYSSEGINF